MAIYRLSMSVETRGKVSPVTGLPANAVRSAAYNARTQLYDETNGVKTPDYSKKGGLLYHEMVLGKNADSRFLNMEKAWSEVEKIETGNSAQLSRKLILALPHEFTLEQDKELMHEFMRENFPEAAFYQFDIHNDESGTIGGKNIHAHVKFPERILDKNGKWIMKQRSDYVYEKDANGNIVMEPVLRKNGKPKMDKSGHSVMQKKRVPVIDPVTGIQKIGAKGRKIWKRETVHATDWHRKDKLLSCRKSWATIINRIAERDLVRDEVTGELINVSEKSHKERRDGLVPEPPLGPIVANLAKRGIVTDRYREFRAVREGNQRIRELQKIEKSESDKELAAMFAQEHLEGDLNDEKYNFRRAVYEYNKLVKDQINEEASRVEHEAIQRAINEQFEAQKYAEEYDAEQKRLAQEYDEHLAEEQRKAERAAKEQAEVAARLNAAMQIALESRRRIREYQRFDKFKYDIVHAAETGIERVDDVIAQREEKRKAALEKAAFERKYGQDGPQLTIKEIHWGIRFGKRPRAVIITFEDGKRVVTYGHNDYGKLLQHHRGDLQRFYDQHPEISPERRVSPENLKLELQSSLEKHRGKGR